MWSINNFIIISINIHQIWTIFLHFLCSKLIGQAIYIVDLTFILHLAYIYHQAAELGTFGIF